MTDEGVEGRGGDALIAWVAFGVIVGIAVGGLTGRHFEAGVGYGALGGLVVAWFAGRRR